MCGVTTGPVTPPPLTSARPTNNSQKMGEAGRAKARGGGGRGALRVLRPGFLTCKRKCKNLAARCKRHAKTPNPTTQNQEAGGQSAARDPTHPEEEKAPLGPRPRKAEKNIDEIAWGEPRLVKNVPHEAVP